MIKGLYHAAAGMLPRMNQQETVGNNLANVNTTGFKADHRFFQTELNNTIIQSGQYGEIQEFSEDEVSLVTDFSQGSLSETRNPLDIAINGDGFFVLETGDINSFTRNGNFMVNAEGELVNSRDYKVLGENGPITIVGREVVISADGSVVVDGVLIDKIKIVDFEEPYDLRRNGFGYFIPTVNFEEIDSENMTIKQGFLENSNVDPIAEMVRMIELNRNYESCQKAIHAQDTSLGLAVNQIAGVS